MEERSRKGVDRLKIKKIQVTILLLFTLSVGLIIGLIVGRVTTFKWEMKTEVEAITPVAKETLSVDTEIVNSLTKRIRTIVNQTPIVFYDVPLSETLQEYIILLCEKEKVPVTLVMAMIDQESTFQIELISKTDDYGLMQINSCNHNKFSKLYGITDFLDPYQNVHCGVSIISDYLKKYEDTSYALMCYNMGEYGARQLWDKGIESTSYSRSVLTKMDKYIGAQNE